MTQDLPHQQREALAAIGGWAIVRALAEPEEWVSHLRCTRYGSTHLSDGSWPEGTGFNCTDRGIEVGRRHPTRDTLFVITWIALTHYARGIGATDRAALIAVTQRSQAHAMRDYPLPPTGLTPERLSDWQRTVHDPYTAEGRDLAATEAGALAAALHLHEGQQLDLFT